VTTQNATVSTTYNKSVLSLLRRRSTRHYPHILLSAGAWYTAPASADLIDISCPQGAQQQIHRPRSLLSIDGTDGRTLNSYIVPAPHTLRAASVSSVTGGRFLNTIISVRREGATSDVMCRACLLRRHAEPRVASTRTMGTRQ